MYLSKWEMAVSGRGEIPLADIVAEKPAIAPVVESFREQGIVDFREGDDGTVVFLASVDAPFKPHE